MQARLRQAIMQELDRSLPENMGYILPAILKKIKAIFLYALTQGELSETMFPVGDMVKKDVRQILANNQFEMSSKAESQDICFVADSVANFIEKNGHQPKKGLLKTKDGKVMGEHEGIYNYTVGQRKGLGIGHHSPLYVININPEDDTVLIGEKGDLEKSEFFVRNETWVSGKVPEFPIRAYVKLRYRHAGVPCLIERAEDVSKLKLTFEK